MKPDLVRRFRQGAATIASDTMFTVNSSVSRTLRAVSLHDRSDLFSTPSATIAGSDESTLKSCTARR
jgi:hypothetical protein